MNGIDVKETRDGFKITYQRISWKILFPFLNLLFIIIVMLILTILGSESGLMPVVWIRFILVSMAILYSIYHEYIKKTEIHVFSNYIRIQHKPFSFFRNHIFHKTQIKKIYRTSQKTSYNNEAYDIAISTNSDSKYILVPAIQDFDQARYLELKLKVRLGLEDIQN